MMAIIADVHGNFPALRSVLNEIDQENIKDIVCLGDVSGYYCMLNECVGALCERDVVNIMGNHDHYLVSGVRCTRSNSANVCLDYQRTVVDPENLQWLAKSPPCLEFGDVSMTHGGWNDFRDEYLYEISSKSFAHLPWTFLFSAHTHVQVLARFSGGQVYCNPGSVGQPRDGDPRAAWAVFTGGDVILRRTAYDIEETVGAMRLAGFSSQMSANLRDGVGIGRKPDRAFVRDALTA
jgi:predicted phosphodiesterase